MGSRNSLLALLLCAVLLAFVLEGTDAKHLKLRFYRKTCPKAEAIVRKTVAGFIARDATIAAPLLRLHFHDCFVRGCDGSVLLNSTQGNTAEKDAPPNLSLEGYDVIDAAKAELEKACPGVVSCADIAALAARDGIALNGGPSWKVKTGRRDGRISRDSEALAELPPPDANISSLIETFGRKKLNLEDLVLLSGGHTIGISHCSSFDKRLYNFTGKGDTDPSLDPAYVRKLKKQCKPNDQTTVVDMDPGSAVNFDSSYFRAVIKKRGLFESDAALLNDRVTRSFVNLYAKNTPEFFHEFGVAMGKMGRIEVLTGKKGEIRKHCAVVNPR